jgi:hypothetical protein
LLSEASDSRAAKAVVRLTHKTLRIVSGRRVMRFGKANRCISQQSSTQRNDQLAQVSIFGFQRLQLRFLFAGHLALIAEKPP